MKLWKRLAGIAAAAALAAAVAAGASAADVTAAAKYVYGAAPSPEVGSVGGEWAVIGLARSGYAVPEEYYGAYCAAVRRYAAEGELGGSRYTDYSRLVLALTAAGRDPEEAAGTDLTAPLGDFARVARQGINGPIWALTALDSGGYAVPEYAGGTQATRRAYVGMILGRALPGGGWSMLGGTAYASADEKADPDVTAMALTALSRYRGEADVDAAVDAALSALSELQLPDGGFATAGTETCESAAQAAIALSALGISADDPRFVKNGKTAEDAIMSFALPSGGFRHTAEGTEANGMASEQALLALDALRRAESGLGGLYAFTETRPGLPGKNAAVTAKPITARGAHFADADGDACAAAAAGLAERGVLEGRGDGTFCPGDGVTRAEFAAMAVRALGLPEGESGGFADVGAGDWFAPYVGAAAGFGIVNGVSEGEFAPYVAITRQEAAVMTARAAALCGVDTAARDGVLAEYADGGDVAGWAREGTAYCLGAGLLGAENGVRPAEAATRGEAAELLFRMLRSAKLI